MINYYEILGLNYGAGILEIKASFRHLAKLYHPDKNPDGIEHFAKILKAYETLSDPVQKASYDYKLNYHQSQVQYQSKTAAATKTWKFDEKELKRRQYYNDHIKRYAKQTSEYMAEAGTKKNYNEFKYILFATPLAVVLFLLIMHFATRDRHEAIAAGKRSEAGSPETAKTSSDLRLGDAPYDALFGPAVYDNVHDQKLLIKNITGKDVIVCLFTPDKYIRHFYLSGNHSAEVSELPEEPLYIYYSNGLYFDRFKKLEEANVSGGFTKDEVFYKSSAPVHLDAINELTLTRKTDGFEQIGGKDFFKRIKR